MNFRRNPERTLIASTAPSRSPEWFSSRALKFNSLMGIVAFVVALFDILGWINLKWLLEPKNFQFLLVNIVFLGTIHIVFTIILIMFSREFLFRLQTIERRFRWFVPLLGVVIGLSLLAFSTRYIFEGSHQFVVFFGLIAPTFHAASQNKGLSLGMIKPSKPKRALVRLWTFNIGYLILIKLVQYFQISDVFEKFLFVSCFLLFSLLAFFSILTLRQQNISVLSAQSLFHARLLLFPLILLSDAAAFAVACLHGIEYVSVVLSQVSYKEFMKFESKSYIIWGMILLVALGTWGATFASEENLIGIILSTVIATAVFSHYYIDSFIFRSPGFYKLKI